MGDWLNCDISSVVKMQLPIHLTTWMNFKSIMLSGEKNQYQKIIYCRIVYKPAKIQSRRIISDHQGLEVGGLLGVTVKG